MTTPPGDDATSRDLSPRQRTTAAVVRSGTRTDASLGGREPHESHEVTLTDRASRVPYFTVREGVAADARRPPASRSSKPGSPRPPSGGWTAG